ncbi:MAG: Pr6Pr family membrane protein [Rhizobiales bacterium]|nr:Pr6Pr family membrane protein [Hyphomicrobiales bacterium]
MSGIAAASRNDISRAGRAAAAVIALATWVALALQLWLSIGLTLRNGGSVAGGVFLFVSYFTILTNLLLAAVLTALAFGRIVGASLIGAVTLFIVIVGIVYALLLRATWNPQGWQKVADMALHDLTPLLAVAFWLGFVPKGRLAWQDAARWLLFPLGYFIFALARGASSGWWAYPFLNADALGYQGVMINAVILTLAFLGLGLLLVAIDRSLGRIAR